jgi:hypothetical protein
MVSLGITKISNKTLSISVKRMQSV